MNAVHKGLLLVALQVGIVASLGAKLAWDRHHLPRAWAKAGSYDPNLPIRGRYLALQLEVLCDNGAAPPAVPQGVRHPDMVFGGYKRGRLRVEKGRLASDCSSGTGTDEGVSISQRWGQGQAMTSSLSEPVLFFLPEHADDPWQLAKGGGELWAEVTVPINGPPRPIRLAIKKGNAFNPLEIK